MFLEDGQGAGLKRPCLVEGILPARAPGERVLDVGHISMAEAFRLLQDLEGLPARGFGPVEIAIIFRGKGLFVKVNGVVRKILPGAR